MSILVKVIGKSQFHENFGKIQMTALMLEKSRLYMNFRKISIEVQIIEKSRF